MVKKEKTIYMCDNCGNEFSSWSGRCTICGEWNTLKEVRGLAPIKHSDRREIKFSTLGEIKVTQNYRINTGIGEFDRVLGGGIVPGSVILLGGEPGIGKSTIILQVCESVKNVLYVSGEESLTQIKVRADRLNVKQRAIKLVSDGDLESMQNEILKEKPELLIIDSIQTVFLASVAATPGSMVQVRECGIFLQQLAKKTGIPIIIVGHVTKEGLIAGPRMLEHLVDVVLYLEGERFNEARLLRGVKNRFGATNEVGIFAIEGNGLREIKNPSELFLSEKQNDSGSVVTSTLEGTRPILVEVQALVATTRFGYPKMTASGFDLNRLNLLSAVISKKTNMNLSNSDIYVNVVGGLKIKDPAIDLAVCLAIVSSFRNKAFPNKLCAFGEVGLSGEIRKVTRQKDRAKEAAMMGYFVPEQCSNLSDLLKSLQF